LFNETTRTLDGARTQSLTVPMMILIAELYFTGIYTRYLGVFEAYKKGNIC